MNKIRSPLKYHGGKTYLAKDIIARMPPHTHYAEPYFGGGAVLFVKDPNNVSETVNDVNGELTNFWSVLKSPDSFDMFQRYMEFQALCEVDWRWAEKAKDITHAYFGDNRIYINNAVNFFIKYRQSRQALGEDYVTPTRRRRRGMNEQVSAWLSAVEGLSEAHERLIRVEIRNMDAIDFICKYDHENCLFYCDPPYMPETRNAKNTYENEMTYKQHSDLLNCLVRIKGKFILSGYRSYIYDVEALNNEWNRVDIKIDNKASSTAVKPIKTECLWMNF